MSSHTFINLIFFKSRGVTNSMIGIICTILGGALWISCSKNNSDTIFPKDVWGISAPKGQGVDQGKMLAALNYLESECNHNGIKEVIIVRNGYIIFDGGQTDSIHNIWSCSKTFTSTVLGLLIDDGKISLDDKVARFEPLLENEYPDVTFRHFASMTSGYSAKGGSRWPDQTYADWSWTVYDPDTPYFAPGTAYAYWDEAQMTFGRALTQVLQQPMEAYLKEKVTNQIGMEWRWGTEKEVHGIPINNGCTGVMLNAKNLARWGWLFCNQGSWDGTQLISKNWVNQATAVQVPNSIPVGETDRDNVVGPGCYGFNWWVNGMKADGQWKLPGAPEDTYFASGFNNNKCFVIPSWKMVVIRMGEDVNLPEADKIYGNFLARLGKAVLES